MTSEKIWALLGAFVLGAALATFVCSRLIGFVIHHSSAARAYLRVVLDRREHELLCGAPRDLYLEDLTASRIKDLVERAAGDYEVNVKILEDRMFLASEFCIHISGPRLRVREFYNALDKWVTDNER